MATPIWSEKKQKWIIRVTVNYKVKEFTSNKRGLTGKKEVLRKSREWLENGSTNRYNARCESVWCKFMEDSSKRLGAQSEAIRLYDKIGRLYILPSISNRKMSSIRKDEYQDIINNAKPHNKRTTTLSKKYLSTIRMVIKLFVDYGAENGYCEHYYGNLYIPSGHPTVGKEILQPEDIKKLFEPSDLHYHLALCFMCVTGLRPSECLGLKWSDISNDTITINRGVTTSGQISDGKNKNARRVIPLSPIVRGILDRQRDNTKHLKSEWVFCSQVGAVGSQSTLGHQLDKLCDERGFNVSPYCLRHTFVSMVKNSIPEQMIKSLVGHSVSMDTFGVYGHRVNGELKQAAELVELRFNEINEELK